MKHEQLIMRVLEQHQFAYGGTICRCGRKILSYGEMAVHQTAAISAELSMA
jgi:hypothetical protein